MTDDDLRQLADLDFYRAQTLLMTTATPIGEVVEGRDLFLVSTGAPFGAFNVGIVKPDGEDVDAAIERTERYFKSRDLPYRIQLRNDQLESLEPRLLEAGYVAVPPIPAMVLRKIPEAPRVPDGLEIERVEGPEAAEAFRGVAERGFGMPAGMGTVAISDRVVRNPDTALFLGRVDGVPVATTLLVLSNQVAGIYFVATEEAYRQKGFGEALTWAGALEGRRRGAGIASLQASEMGRPVYERMGFETLSVYHMYASPGSDPSAGFLGN